KAHRLFCLVLLTVSLLGCDNLTMAESTSSILDDGEMELTPEYNVQHIQGQPYSDVYAAFNFVSDKKSKPARLRKGDSISVNGHPLEEINHFKGYYYQGRIPETKGLFTFTLSRAPGKITTHAFDLPVLGV